MQLLVTPGTESDQVLFGIVSQPAAQVDVVDLEVGAPAAVLAAPAIALQHLLAQLTIGLRVEPEPGAAREQASHDAFLSCSKNCRRCGGGRN